MAADPLISICIPVYNGAPYLRECLDSCVNQTYHKYELIICDDGSTDNSIEIIETYLDKHPNIFLFKNTVNLGLVRNWNRCLELSKGSWIKFVFQDDYMRPDCLLEFTKKIDDTSQLMVSERDFLLPVNATNESRQYYSEIVRTLRNTTSYQGNNYSPDLISKIAVKNPIMNFIGEPSLTFFKKSLLSELGYFNSELKQVCDLEFFLRIASVYGLTYVPQKLCTFRVHSDSTTASNISNRFFELRYVEPVIFAWILLYDKHYRKFRSHLNAFQALRLKLYFKVKTYEANLVNVKESRNYYIFNASNSPYPQIIDNKQGSFFVKFISKMMS